MAKITERIVYEVQSTSITPQIVDTINVNTKFGMSGVERFMCTFDIRAWSYNSSALDAESSASFGSYDTNTTISFSRAPTNFPNSIIYSNNEVGASDNVQTLVHVRGRNDMITGLEVNYNGDNESLDIVLTAGAATGDSQTLDHMLIVDINMFTA